MSNLLLAIALASPLVQAPAAPADPTLEQLEARLAAHPDDRQALWELAHLYWRLDRDDDAERLFHASTERFGEQAYSERMLGALAEERFDLLRARAHYERARALDAALPGVAADLSRVAGAIEDVTRFRRVDERLQRDLLLVGGAWGILVVAFVLASGRLQRGRGAPA
jgi:hypothetical protein